MARSPTAARMFHLFVVVVAALVVQSLTTVTGYPHPLERIFVTRLPTGTPRAAQILGEELERAGLDMRYDHARTRYVLEAALRPTDMTRLTDDRRATMRIVRNLTVSGHGRPRVRPGNPLSRLPIDKGRYHSAGDTEHVLRALSRAYPNRAGMRNLGRSDRGAIIWALKVSGQARGEEVWKPAVLFTGSTHGDDPLGREMCLWLAEYLCRAYTTVVPIHRLLDRLDVYLLPDPNPDASTAGQRYTLRGVDFDRSFPDRSTPLSDPILPEPAVEALMEWARRKRFVASATFLGGGGGPGHLGMVVRYPWNGNRGRVYDRSERTPDDRAFRLMARTYARAHSNMAREDPHGGPEAGTVNGAAWYLRYGSMQDWMYAETGSLHLDVVTSSFLKPLPQDLPSYWTANREAILAFVRAADSRGVRGTVTDAVTNAPVQDATVMVRDLNDRGHHLLPLRTEEVGGNFARIMVPGRYVMWVHAPGYKTSQEYMFRLDGAHSRHTINVVLSAT